MPIVARHLGLGLAVLAVCLLTSGRPASAEDDPVVLYDYVVQKGDTCIGIAMRELGDRKAYKQIHQHNKLGPLPHRLKPGSILRLPKQGPSGPDANLSGRRGDVAVREARRDNWASAILGMDLFRRWRVSSRKRATAEVTFRDTSRLRMRENTVVIIYGPSASRARRRTTRATLERGTLRSRLAELDGRDPQLIVETDSSETELGGGSALVSVDDAAIARVSNHEGRAAKVRRRRKGRSRKAVSVAPGMGSKVEKGKEPSPPRPLPPTPAWSLGPSHFVGWAHQGSTLRGAWLPVSEAAEYRVEISGDAKGADIVAAVTVPKTVTTFEAHGFPPGIYYATVASRDADKFESAPSSVRKLIAEPLAVTPFGADAPLVAQILAADQIVDVAARERLRVLPGSRVSTPDSVTCSVGDGDPSSEVVLVGSGELRCTRGDEKLAPLAYEVIPVAATLEASSAAGSRRIPRGPTVLLRVQIASEHAISIEKLAVVLSDGLELVRRRDKQGAIELLVRARSDAPSPGSVRILFGASGPELTTMPIVVEAKPLQGAPLKPRARRQWEVGAMVGGNLIDDEYQLGNAPMSRGVIDSGWLVGARIALHTTPALFIEAEGTYGEPGFVGLLDHTNVIGYRIHGGAFLRPGRLRPFVVGGIGGSFLNTSSTEVQNDTDKEIHWGLGVQWRRDARSIVRVDLRHRVANGRESSFSNLLEASLGIGWML